MKNGRLLFAGNFPTTAIKSEAVDVVRARYGWFGYMIGIMTAKMQAKGCSLLRASQNIRT